jgi:hypothetical protein
MVTCAAGSLGCQEIGYRRGVTKAAPVAEPAALANTDEGTPGAALAPAPACAPLVDDPHGLHLTVRYDMPTGDLGDTHVPDSADILDPLHHEVIHLTASVGDELWTDATPLPPILERSIALDPTHALALGWTSLGSGMETLHALLVGRDAAGALTLLDRLLVTTHRGESALFLCRGPKGPLLGVPVASLWPDEGDEAETLVVSGRTLAPDAVVATAPPTVSASQVYAPPFDEYQVGQVAWIDLADGGMKLIGEKEGSGAD